MHGKFRLAGEGGALGDLERAVGRTAFRQVGEGKHVGRRLVNEVRPVGGETPTKCAEIDAAMQAGQKRQLGPAGEEFRRPRSSRSICASS